MQVAGYWLQVKNRRKAGAVAALFAAVILLGIFSFSAANDVSGWKQAEKPRTWSFPGDHGAHPDYRTEWWYFTGNLENDLGNRYGYQLTFFREGIRRRVGEPRTAWSLSDLYLAHFTVTDVRRRQFTVHERISRTGPGLAGARTDSLAVWLLNWSATQKGRSIWLEATDSGIALGLHLLPRKPVVLHGDRGLSRKGERTGQASYYASYTDLITTGSLKTPTESQTIGVNGLSWFDHEFGSNQLTADQAGWDWFSLHLSDGRELMLYLIRKTDGSPEPASSGTIVGRKGGSRHLTLSETTVEVLDRWKSKRSGSLYPSRWRIRIEDEGIDLNVWPEIRDQELLTPGSTGITYWEGAVRGEGTSGGRQVAAQGYIELTGYAGKIGGLF